MCPAYGWSKDLEEKTSFSLGSPFRGVPVCLLYWEAEEIESGAGIKQEAQAEKELCLPWKGAWLS